MKRYLLILFIIISLLASCSTTKAKNTGTPVEAPVTETRTTQETTPAAEETTGTEVPVEETPREEAPEEVEKTEVEEEQPVAEQEVAEEETAVAEVPEAETEQETPVEEQDWSQVIGAAPSEQTEETAPAEEEKAPEKSAAEPETEAPKAEAAPSKAPARKASFVDRLTSVIKKVGTFISEQILLSIGIFVCFGGFVYLVVILAVSARRDRRGRNSYIRHTPKEKEESDSFKAAQDKDPESDDDFLKSLLGDDNS